MANSENSRCGSVSVVTNSHSVAPVYSLRTGKPCQSAPQLSLDDLVEAKFCCLRVVADSSQLIPAREISTAMLHTPFPFHIHSLQYAFFAHFRKVGVVPLAAK